MYLYFKIFQYPLQITLINFYGFFIQVFKMSQMFGYLFYALLTQTKDGPPCDVSLWLVPLLVKFPLFLT